MALAASTAVATPAAAVSSASEPKPESLADVLEKCAALGGIRDGRVAEPEAEAFEALRAAIIAARREPSALDVQRHEGAAAALELLVKTWRERKVLRNRATECLKALLARDCWLRVAQQRAGLREALAEVFGDSPEMQARLAASVPSPEAAGSKEPRRSSQRNSTDPESEFASLREALANGRDVMRGFNWKFPQQPVSAQLDTATESFMAFYTGLTRLSIVLQDHRLRKDHASEVAAVAGGGGRSPLRGGCTPDLGLDEADWPGVLRFLESMYNCGSRNTYRSRIKFVAAGLEELSPGFADAVAAAEREDGGLPWSCAGEGEVEAAPAALPVPVGDVSADGDAGGGPQVAAAAASSDAVPRGFLKKFGRLAVCNLQDQELVLYVEQTQQEIRLMPGATARIETEVDQVHVRINFVGFFGLTSLRTRLARVTLVHQKHYSVVKDENGKTLCVEL